MKPKEVKQVCNIISIVAQAIATNTIAEAEDYILERFDDLEDPIIQHALSVMDKQQQSEPIVINISEMYYG